MTTFAVGFMVRPLGQFSSEAYIDHIGRPEGLLLTLALMSVGHTAIARVPGYETIGLFAPIVWWLAVYAGFSAASNWAVSRSTCRNSNPGHKGFYVSWQSAAAGRGGLRGCSATRCRI